MAIKKLYNENVSKKDLSLEKLEGGLCAKDCALIDAFFLALDEKTDLPIYSRKLLREHFIKGFEYYLNKGKSVEDICEILSVGRLGDFYNSKRRNSYALDNAAIVYPLGMKYGKMPMFRLSVQLKNEVEPILLQLALDFTIRRFPFISAVIKNGFFWHYLETCNTLYPVEEEKDIPCKPISISLRSHRSFRILYYRKRISVEFFHVLTDGSGGMVFLKTLLAEYLRLNGINVKKELGVLDVNEEVKEEELENEFRKAKENASFSTFVDKKSLQIDGKIGKLNLSRIVHFEMDKEKLHQTAKNYGGTITAYLCALEFLAARECIREKDGVFNIQVPVNMRKFNHSKTLRNYSMYFNVSERLEHLPKKEDLVKEISLQIKEKGSEEMMNRMMATTGKLISSLSYLPLFLKMPIMQLVYDYFSNSIIGSTLSNLGDVQLPEGMKDEVEKFYFLLVPGNPNRITSTLVSVNDTGVFTLIRNSDDSSFENRMYQLLKEDDLIKDMEASVEYES